MTDPIRKRVRFEYNGITAEEMNYIARQTEASIRGRILKGLDVYDRPAPVLSMNVKERWKDGKLAWMGSDRGYRAQKASKHPPPIRNWTFTGETMKALRVLRYSAKRAVIGFLDVVAPQRTKYRITAAQIAAYNNRRHRQFGVSPKDREVFLTAVRDVVRSIVKRSAPHA